VTLHDLRHCAGQWLTEAGRPEASVQQTLRHKDPTMTRALYEAALEG
jgi:integrase